MLLRSAGEKDGIVMITVLSDGMYCVRGALTSDFSAVSDVEEQLWDTSL